MSLPICRIIGFDKDFAVYFRGKIASDRKEMKEIADSGRIIKNTENHVRMTDISNERGEKREHDDLYLPRMRRVGRL